jgi:hypothetical protein
MGEAKRRGTYEERRAAAIARREAEAEAFNRARATEPRSRPYRSRLPPALAAAFALASSADVGRR